MHELKRVLTESYYTIIFLLATQLWCVLIAWRNRNKFSELRFFHFYPIGSLVQSLLTLLSLVLLTGFEKTIMRISISVFLVVEFLIIFSISFRIIVLKWNRVL